MAVVVRTVADDEHAGKIGCGGDGVVLRNVG